MDDSLSMTSTPGATFMRGVSNLNLWLAWVSAAVLVGATALVFMEILSRLIFDTSLVWVVEVSEYALLYMTLLGAPYLLEKHRHVAIDLVTDALPMRSRQALAVAMCALGAMVCLCCTWYGAVVTLDQLQFGTHETTLLAPPSYLITGVFPLGMLLLSIQFVAQAVSCVKHEGPRP